MRTSSVAASELALFGGQGIRGKSMQNFQPIILERYAMNAKVKITPHIPTFHKSSEPNRSEEKFSALDACDDDNLISAHIDGCWLNAVGVMFQFSHRTLCGWIR